MLPAHTQLSREGMCSSASYVSWSSQAAKAILSQFSNSLDDEETQAAPTPRKNHPAAKCRGATASRSTRGSGGIPNDSDDDSDDNNRNDDNDDYDNNNGDDGDDNSDDDGDTPDQDDDIIQAAEAAQQVDLEEAEQSAKLNIPVTNSERKVASMALSKVGLPAIALDVRIY
jgi:hypothetical protein